MERGTYGDANCLLQQNQLKDAEKAAFEVVEQIRVLRTVGFKKPTCFLGDIYFKEKDYFNAKATFQSIRDNAKIEELRKQADQKLNEVIAEEEKASKINGGNQ